MSAKSWPPADGSYEIIPGRHPVAAIADRLTNVSEMFAEQISPQELHAVQLVKAMLGRLAEEGWLTKPQPAGGSGE